jgi:type III pantothenate kinase
MLAAFDIGNAQVTVGVFDGERLATSFHLASDVHRPSSEYGLLLSGLLSSFGVAASSVDGVAIGSVVPPLTERLSEVCTSLFGCKPIIAGAGVKTGVPVATHNPREVAPDRILNAAAAFHIYGGPLIVVDFGTATSFDVVGPEGAFLGSATAPGLVVGAEALFAAASRLHRVDVCAPRSVVGKDAASALQAGIVFGHAAMVEGMVARIRNETGFASAGVVATGEHAAIGVPHVGCIDHLEPDLTLLGLRLMWDLNRE